MKVLKIIYILRILGKEDVFTCILDIMPKLVALIVYKSHGIMAPNFTYANNNYNH
jgi:hypothetical protein